MDADELNTIVVLSNLKNDMQHLQGDADRYAKYQEIHDLISQVDLSVLESNGCENVTSPSTSKRRKTSRAGSENDMQVSEKQQELEKIEKQIELVKNTLNILYDMENTSFKKFISKNGKKRRNVVSRVIKCITENGQAIPLWVGIENELPPPLCGAMEAEKNYVAKVGDIVAALVKQNKKENWILAEVIEYDPTTEEYKIDDIYEDTKAEQILGRHKIIPLPKYRADPENNPEALFPKACQVLALYPGTTCFYRAIVDKPPEKPREPYQLLFEDDNYDSGYSDSIPVHQRYVVHYDFCSIEEEAEKSDK